MMGLQRRKTRSLYKWLAKKAGVDFCWIEGADDDNNPVWGCIKKLTEKTFLLFSKKMAIASLLLSPLLLNPATISAQTAVELSDLQGMNGVSFLGINNDDYAGSSTASGDINGDGIDDLIIGAPEGDPNGGNSGETYVVFGDTSGFGSSLTLNALNGSNGFTLNGIDGGDQSGHSVTTGDVNGDGIDDLIIGAYRSNGNTGETYVVFGFNDTSIDALELSDLDGTNGFILNGIDTGDQSGISVATGDINGDGITDLIIGAYGADPNGSRSGETYVVFGKTSTFGSIFELDGLDGNNGFILNGVGTDDESGEAVSSGDINGDGKDDVIIAAALADPNGSSSGETYVVFGFNDTSIDTLELSGMDGSNGFVLNGIDNNDRSGKAVSSGDINGDGTADVIIGARYADPNGSSSGETYVVFGFNDASIDTLELSGLNGTNGFILNGIDGGDQSGSSVSSGDINGDGTDDLIIGALFARPNRFDSGETYVVFGFDDTSIDIVELSNLDGSNGFALNGSEYDYSGYSVASGDINGDGFDDVIIGAKGYEASSDNTEGKVYVFFNTTPQTITGDDGFRTLSAPANGTVFDELLGDFFTQGFTGSDAPDSTDNVWTWDQGIQNWTALSNQTTDNLSAGNGFLLYLFSNDNGLGIGEDTGFPKYIGYHQFGGDGTRNTGSINPVSDLDGGDFFFAGNPYLYPIDWDDLTKSGLSNAVYVYDDANSTWQTWNGTLGNLTNGEIAAFQGFFIQGSGGNGSLTIEEADTVSTTVNLLKTGTHEPRALKIHAKAGELSADAWLSFQDGGEIGRDDFDGLALSPLASSYLKLATIIENKDELQINALPVDFEGELRFPFDLSGLTNSSEAMISFEGLEKFEGWTISIKDLETEEVYDLAEHDSLKLAVRNTLAKIVSAPASPVHPKAKSGTHRFELFLKSAVGVSNESPEYGLPEHVRLEQNYPNPFNPVTTINYSVPVQSSVRLEVFDLMGRKIATLVERESMQPGHYQVRFDASKLASGMYLYRLKAGNRVLTKRLSLIK